MTILNKSTSALALALSLSLLVVGVAVNASAGEEAIEIAKNDRLIKPVQTGTETRCRYDEFEDVWSCRL